jgi:uncharacterized protein YcfL
MKKYILIFAIFTLLTSCATLTQKPETPTENVVLTSNVKQQTHLFSAKDLSTEDGVNFGEFKVIICGKTITDLAEKKIEYEMAKKTMSK